MKPKTKHDLPHLLTRKDIADMLNVCERTVMRQEQALGLLEARVRWSSRRVNYRRDKVLAILTKRGLICPDLS